MQAIPPSENELLKRLAEGDATAYRELFVRHWDAVYSSALLLSRSPDIAEDIAQEVFVTLWEKRAQLVQVEKLESYFFVMARNQLYSRLRKLSSQDAYRRYLLDYQQEVAHSGAEARAEFKELEGAIHSAIRRLPPQQQKAFRMSRFEGKGHEEIAQAMGVSRITIKSYIVQALASLRKFLAHYPGVPLLLYCALQPVVGG
ncbi:RNA polymerase sigma-70 factor (ECF subfamily) [Chitinophaga polysaccharea]|uniref:RNA polymerase sigma-70 factor (ECF subfamily) n=1 Tax=Chitinophaga polysaccharea TaxID=1293035 RepID=A0A561PB15_9BACT|nr:RNA polymerase sigma-70 factor [Chitinophaga polysaccharea]TWF35334.1 RNA polymerase sigma-70 factor (ECF subfamily) [Chitinophaga polysaccharea]